MIRVVFAFFLPLSAAWGGNPRVPLQEKSEDFEKRESLTVIYDGWEQVQTPDHPPYNDVSVVLDAASAPSGNHYLRFRTQGGNTAFQMLKSNAWKIDPARSYRFSAYVRLTGTKSNAAFITLNWMDERYAAIQEDRSSALADAGAWTEMSVDIPRLPLETRWMTARLNFEGPDVRGECAFDKLQLGGQTRILIAPAGAGLPVFDRAAAPEYAVTVPALPEGEHTVELASRTLWNVETARSARTPIASNTPVTLKLPPHAPGFYEVRAEIRNGSGIVTQRTVPLIVPNPWVSPSPAARMFGGAFNPFTTGYVNPGGLATLAGLRQAKVTLWDRASAGRREIPDSSTALLLVRQLAETEGIEVIGVLGTPTRRLVPGVERAILDRGPIALFGLEESLWEKPFRSVAERAREIVTRWQIGGDDDPHEASRDGAEDGLSAAAAMLRGINRFARVGVPVRPEDTLSLALPSARFYCVSTRASARAEDLLQPIDAPGRELFLTASLPPLRGDDILDAARTQVAEMLHRLVCAAAGGSKASSIFLPVEVSSLGGMLDSDGYPRPTLLALRAANDVLSGAVYRKDVHIFEPPIRDFVFEKDGRYCIVLWSDKGEVEKDLIPGYDAIVYPPLGEVRKSTSGEKHRIGPLPLFIGNVDPQLLETQLSLRFHNPDSPAVADNTLPLRADMTPRLLLMKNHYKDGEISNVQIRVGTPLPPRWTLRPSVVSVSRMAVGEEISREYQFTLPPDEAEGPREIRLEMSFTRGGKEYALQTPRTVVVVSRIEATAQSVPLPDRPGDRKVTVKVINRSGRPLNLMARIRLPGLPEQIEPLGRIAPDASVNRKLEYVVRDIDQVPPERRHAEILCEEFGGDRLHARRIIPLP